MWHPRPGGLSTAVDQRNPASPRRPPFNEVTAAVLGLLDRAADSLTDRPTTIEELRN